MSLIVGSSVEGRWINSRLPCSDPQAIRTRALKEPCAQARSRPTASAPCGGAWLGRCCDFQEGELVVLAPWRCHAAARWWEGRPIPCPTVSKRSEQWCTPPTPGRGSSSHRIRNIDRMTITKPATCAVNQCNPCRLGRFVHTNSGGAISAAGRGQLLRGRVQAALSRPCGTALDKPEIQGQY